MHLLEINHLTESQLLDLFKITDELKRNISTQSLAGKTFALFFPDNSLRTRITFEKGIQQLGGNSILFAPETLNKKEDLGDVVKYLENWVDGLVIRHPDLLKLKTLASHASIPVINAMTAENHPCEVLSDLYTIAERRENYKHLTYTFVGTANNISRSWADLAKVMDLRFRHVCTAENQIGESTRNYSFFTCLKSALEGSDVVLTDSLSEAYRHQGYYEKYQLTLDNMQLTNKGAMLNPCPPFFRNEEISADVIDSDYFVGHAFKKNLIHVQQAIMLYCLAH